MQKDRFWAAVHQGIKIGLVWSNFVTFGTANSYKAAKPISASLCYTSRTEDVQRAVSTEARLYELESKDLPSK